MTDKRLTCRHCGYPMEDPEGFCPKCGEFGGTPAVRRPWLWGTLVVLALTAAVCLYGEGGIFPRPSRTPDRKPEAQITLLPAEETPVTPETPENATRGQRKALEDARDYLSWFAFSHDGLVEQLETDGHSHRNALYAADHCGADWNAMALKSAGEYLELSAYSERSLAEMLEFVGYTPEEARYGAANIGADWREQAVRGAAEYLEYGAFSETSLARALEYDGFTPEDAAYAAGSCGADWNAQALRAARWYLEYSDGPDSLREMLEYDGFTPEAIGYAMDHVQD